MMKTLRGLLAVLAMLVWHPGAQANGTACTASTGYDHCLVFNSMGADQHFTVPANVPNFLAQVWGAGGGGSYEAAFNFTAAVGGSGGSGGYVSGIVGSAAGNTYAIVAGQGGQAATQGGGSVYGFGGAACSADEAGAGGGGLSGVFNTAGGVSQYSESVGLLIAGGGGGGVGDDTLGGGSSWSGSGGAGGSAQSGGNPLGTMSGYGSSSALEPCSGAGGGAVGGTQTTLWSGANVEAATGGTNYVSPSVTGASNLPGNQSTTPISAVDNAAPKNSDPQYVSGIGVGSALNPGGNGQVVIQWVQPQINIAAVATTLPGSFSYEFTYSGLANSSGNAVNSGSYLPVNVSPTSPVVLWGAGSIAPTIAEINGIVGVQSIVCTDANHATDGNSSVVAQSSTAGVSSITIPATAMVAHANITCTFTQMPLQPTLTLAKTWSAGSHAGDTVTVTGAGFTNTATVGPSVATAAGNTTTGTTVTVNAGDTGTITESFSSGSASNYIASLSCSGNSIALNGNKLTVGASDSAITCTMTNSASPPPTLVLKATLTGTGRINPADQFQLNATGPGAPAPADSTGSGTNLNFLSLGFVAQAGSAYSLTETMKTGSVSTLSQYSQTVSCTNSGPTSVTSFTSLPINVTPANGDAITCSVTDTPTTVAVITGVVFKDNGTGGGSANDGVQDGGEVGLPSVTMKLTDCSGNVLASATTDGAGNYSLPLGSASGNACVQQIGPTGYTATGANAAGTVLPTGVGTSALGTTMTYTRNTGSIQVQLVAGSSYAGLNFGDVPANQLLTDGSRSALPGGTVSYPHTFVAGTAGQVSFDTAATATPANSDWTQTIYRDITCSGSPASGDTVLLPGTAVSVQAGDTVCLLVNQAVPAGVAVGARNNVSVNASFVYANAIPSLNASYTRTDLTTVSDAPLVLTKTVRNVSTGGIAGASNQAGPGDTLEYQITFVNNGANPLSSITINDATPAYSSLVMANCGTLPSALGTCGPPAAPVGYRGPVKWTFSGSLPAGQSGTVLFQVKLDP